MSCKNVCKLCDKFIISQSISYSGNTVVVDLPNGNYANKEKYCIVFAQTIPSTATIGSNVVFTIGGGTTQYPLVNRCCKPVTVCGVRTRTKYSVAVETTSTGANFKMLGNACCTPDNSLEFVSGATGKGAVKNG